jgi:hypothetical protein
LAVEGVCQTCGVGGGRRGAAKELARISSADAPAPIAVADAVPRGPRGRPGGRRLRLHLTPQGLRLALRR